MHFNEKRTAPRESAWKTEQYMWKSAKSTDPCSAPLPYDFDFSWHPLLNQWNAVYSFANSALISMHAKFSHFYFVSSYRSLIISVNPDIECLLKYRFKISVRSRLDFNNSTQDCTPSNFARQIISPFYFVSMNILNLYLKNLTYR